MLVMESSEKALTLLYESLDLVGPEWDLVEAEVKEAHQITEHR